MRDEREEPDPTAIGDVLAERAAQDQQWGGSMHDDEHTEDDWLLYIDKQRDAAADAIEGCGPNWRGQVRQRFVKMAALAVAAIESMDRQYPDIAPAALLPQPAERPSIEALSTPTEEELSDQIDTALKYLAMEQGYTLNGLARLFVNCQRRMSLDWEEIGSLRRQLNQARKAAALASPPVEPREE